MRPPKRIDPRLYRGGFLIVDVLTATAIAVCVHTRARIGGTVLDMQPLRWIGVRSYGIYLWHWPVFMLTRPQLDVRLDSWPLFLLRVILVGALSPNTQSFSVFGDTDSSWDSSAQPPCSHSGLPTARDSSA